MNYSKGSTANIILWAIVIVVLGGILFMMSRVNPAGNSAPAGDLRTSVSESDWSTGPSDATVTIVEYSDFQCPACRSYSPVLKSVLDDYPENVRLIYRHFPLTTIHPNAVLAARAAEAAGNQDSFFQMHDALFAGQDEWENERHPDELFIEYAGNIGLDVDKFTNDFQSKDSLDAVNFDRFDAEAMNLNSTPTIFLDGERLDPIPSGQVLTNLIEAKLN
jgi:protein-disulfide isomerase